MVATESVAAARRVLARLFAPSRVQFAEGLGAYLKLESELPTGTFKVRGAVYALCRRMESAATPEVDRS
jgi:threonine dehydratase